MQLSIAGKTCALTLGACLVFSASAEAVTYRINELPPAAGYVKSFARNINDSGVIVGDSHPMVADYFTGTATVWRGLVPANLGKVAKGTYSFATAINNLGKIAGDADDGDGRPNAVVFKGGAAKFIDSGASNSHVQFIANSGFIVGNYANGFGGGDWQPTIWTENPKKPGTYKRQFLPRYTNPNGLIAYQNTIEDANNYGVAVGHIESTSAAVWNNNTQHTLEILPQLPEELGAMAFGVNDTGVIVGGANTSTLLTKPVMWAADANRTITSLPLFPGESTGLAQKINNANQIIGSHGDGTAEPALAVWIDGQIFDLQSNLDSTGLGWVLQTVNDINNLGQIVGTGQLNGQERGFILTPVAP